jgi:hypothetical protein
MAESRKIVAEWFALYATVDDSPGQEPVSEQRGILQKVPRIPIRI